MSSSTTSPWTLTRLPTWGSVRCLMLPMESEKMPLLKVATWSSSCPRRSLKKRPPTTWSSGAASSSPELRDQVWALKPKRLVKLLTWWNSYADTGFAFSALFQSWKNAWTNDLTSSPSWSLMQKLSTTAITKKVWLALRPLTKGRWKRTTTSFGWCFEMDEQRKAVRWWTDKEFYQNLAGRQTSRKTQGCCRKRSKPQWVCEREGIQSTTTSPSTSHLTFTYITTSTWTHGWWKLWAAGPRGLCRALRDWRWRHEWRDLWTCGWRHSCRALWACRGLRSNPKECQGDKVCHRGADLVGCLRPQQCMQLRTMNMARPEFVFSPFWR